MYKTVTWNTGSAATRFLVKRKQKAEPPANKKLINKLHDEWCRANGYRQASNKRALTNKRA